MYESPKLTTHGAPTPGPSASATGVPIGVAVGIAVVTSVASLVYYLRPAMLLFMPDRTPAREYAHGQRPATSLTVALGVAGITVLGLLPNLWYAWVADPAIWELLAGR